MRNYSNNNFFDDDKIDFNANQLETVNDFVKAIYEKEIIGKKEKISKKSEIIENNDIYPGISRKLSDLFNYKKNKRNETENLNPPSQSQVYFN